eukprot:205031-Pleurochrysis_carterae.AAC.2
MHEQTSGRVRQRLRVPGSAQNIRNIRLGRHKGKMRIAQYTVLDVDVKTMPNEESSRVTLQGAAILELEIGVA